MDMLKNNAVTMVMALGMLCVMLVGGIDISIMSTLALSGMSIGMLLKNDVIVSTPLAFLIAVGIGIVCGLVVGLVISRADVPPIIATMGFMYVFRAMGYLVSNGGEWAGAAALGSFKDFATTKFPWYQLCDLGCDPVLCILFLVYEMDQNRKNDLCGRKQCQRGRGFRYQCKEHQASCLCDHGTSGRSWRRSSGFRLMHPQCLTCSMAAKWTLLRPA